MKNLADFMFAMSHLKAPSMFTIIKRAVARPMLLQLSEINRSPFSNWNIIYGYDSESDQIFFVFIMSRFESKSGKVFWVMSQFDFIPREVTRALSRSDSIRGEFPWVVSWFWVSSWKPLESWVESIQVSEILLESWADSNQFLRRALADSNQFLRRALVSKTQKWAYEVKT